MYNTITYYFAEVTMNDITSKISPTRQKKEDRDRMKKPSIETVGCLKRVIEDKKIYHVKIGKRVFKSFIAVLLCFAVYMLRGREGIPFYSAIAALQCMQPYKESTKQIAAQRTIGTIIGAIFGLVVELIELYLLGNGDSLEYYLLVSVFVAAVLLTAAAINKKNTAYFSCVVFLSITVVHMDDPNPYLFVWGRVLDTMIGILIGILINSFEIPRKTRKNILLVSGLDGTLFSIGNSISAYSKILLNRMIESGAEFMVSSARTPASVIEATAGINLKHPIIAMDGAVLYDIKEKRYVNVYDIPSKLMKEVREFFDSRGYQYFLNTLLDGVLVIYYGAFNNEIEKDIYRKCRVSAYRNYMQKQYFDDRSQVVYFMIVEKTEKLSGLYEELKASNLAEQLKILFYPSTDYPGYSYLKVYNKEASKQAMLDHYMEKLPLSQAVTCGSIEGAYDIYVPENDSNKVIKKLYKVFKPYFWERIEEKA